MISKEELDAKLKETGYVANEETINALWVPLLAKRPLILEGPPGSGKTSMSEALAKGLGYDYIRIQMYEGLTDDRILYDYDYQKMLIVAELTKERMLAKYDGDDVEEIIHQMAHTFQFYDQDFLLPRPILKSIVNEKRTVLCIDELDISVGRNRIYAL